MCWANDIMCASKVDVGFESDFLTKGYFIRINALGLYSNKSYLLELRFEILCIVIKYSKVSIMYVIMYVCKRVKSKSNGQQFYLNPIQESSLLNQVSNLCSMQLLSQSGYYETQYIIFLLNSSLHSRRCGVGVPSLIAHSKADLWRYGGI